MGWILHREPTAWMIYNVLAPCQGYAWEKQYEFFLKVHLSLSHTSLLLKAFMCIPPHHACEPHLNTLITLNEMGGEGMWGPEGTSSLKHRKHSSVGTSNSFQYAVNIMLLFFFQCVSLSMNWKILRKKDCFWFPWLKLHIKSMIYKLFWRSVQLTDSFSLSFHLI